MGLQAGDTNTYRVRQYLGTHRFFEEGIQIISTEESEIAPANAHRGAKAPFFKEAFSNFLIHNAVAIHGAAVFGVGAYEGTGTQANSGFKSFIAVVFIAEEAQFKWCFEVSSSNLELFQVLALGHKTNLAAGAARIGKDRFLVVEVNIADADADAGCEREIRFLDREIVAEVAVEATANAANVNRIRHFAPVLVGELQHNKIAGRFFDLRGGVRIDVLGQECERSQ